MTVDVQTEIVIDRPLETVASYAADPSNAPEWYANIDSVEWKTTPPVAIGSSMSFVARFLGRRLEYTYKIIDLVPGERLVMRTQQGPFPMETTMSGRPSTATRLACRCATVVNRAASPASPPPPCNERCAGRTPKTCRTSNESWKLPTRTRAGALNRHQSVELRPWQPTWPTSMPHSDPSRCLIVERLSRGEATVKELRAPLQMTPPAVSKHPRLLEDAGRIERRRRGRLQLCRLRGERLVDARRWIEQQTEFWAATLDSLGVFLDREQARTTAYTSYANTRLPSTESSAPSSTRPRS